MGGGGYPSPDPPAWDWGTPPGQDWGTPSLRKDMGPVEVLWHGDGVTPPSLGGGQTENTTSRRTKFDSFENLPNNPPGAEADCGGGNPKNNCPILSKYWKHQSTSALVRDQFCILLSIQSLV